ncbi:MAG: SEC-C metal-binding domain-containing protein [Polyangiales bacterium]
MPHDAHFLQRLDRVNDVQVELALRLYRDDGLLRYLFETAGVAESAGRVAISLDDDVEGPFVVVTRAGAFVTCLGKGMSPRPHPIVTRAALDTASRRIGKLRETIAIAKQDDDGGTSRSRRLWERLYKAGDALSREEFNQLAAMQPLLGAYLLSIYFRVISEHHEDRLCLANIGRLEPRHHAWMRRFWNRQHAIGYLMMLLALSGPKLIESLPPEARSLGAHLTLGSTQQGMLWSATRAAWAAGKLGKPVLALFKTAFVEGETWYDVVDAGNGLLALACRHARLRAEIRKALHAQEHRAASLAADDWRRPLWSVYGVSFERCVDQSDALLEWQERTGRGLAVEWARENLEVGHRCRFEREADVPKELAMWWMPSVPASVTQGGRGFTDMLDCIPWAARARPEEFFLPADLEAGVHSSWAPDATTALLDAVPFGPAKGTPHVAAPTPGRNDPCSCGSGRKFKKCCAA